MVQSISQIKFGIDPFTLLDHLIQKYSLDIPEIRNISYDKEADVLYIKFNLTTKAVDNEPIDEDGLILLGLDKNNEVTTLTIIDATALVDDNF